MMLNSLWTFLREIRAPYFAAIALPILLGSAIAWAQQGRFEIGLFAMSLLAGSFLQAGTNMTNDFFDYQRTGEGGPWTLVPPQQVLQGALGFFVVGTMVGVYIALATGPLVLLLGIVGIASGYLYSVPPLRLSGTGVGELLAGLNLGLLTTVGAYYVQVGAVGWIVVWAALPVALLMTAVLVLNGFQPSKLALNRSVWARLGAGRAGLAYAVPALTAYALLISGVALGRLPQILLLALLGLPFAILTIVSAQSGRLGAAVVSAVGAHLSSTAFMALAFWLEGLL